MFEGVRVYTLCANQHEVVVQESSRSGGDLESLIAAGRSNYRVGGGNGWNDMLDDSLGERPSDTFDVKFLCTR